MRTSAARYRKLEPQQLRNPRREPSAQAQRALAFIAHELAAGRPFPGYHKIAAHLEWSEARPVNIESMLFTLERRGLLEVELKPNGRASRWALPEQKP